MKFGARLRHVMVDADMSIGELCEKAEISRSSFWSWASNNKYPRLSNLLRIASVLGMTVSELLEGVDE